MTILPKKKQPKEKNDGENSDCSNSPSSVESGAGRGGSHLRGRPSSPQRWASPPPGDPQDRFDEGASSHALVFSNKRRIRDRSSPHRSIRKQRHDKQTTAGQMSLGRVSNIRTTVVVQQQQKQQQQQQKQQVVVVGEGEEEERGGGFNSEDECYRQDDASLLEKEKDFEVMLLEKKGFVIKKMAEDGACLFRAVADQIFGDQEMHSIVRKNCVDYMAKNVDFFKQFVTEDFSDYLSRKRVENCHGNHIEMHALCELYNRPIEVYQLTLEPINTFHAAYETDNEPIRLSYHRSVHYNSVVNPYKATIGVGLGLPDHQPGLADKMQVRDAVRQSEDSHIEQTMLEDKLRETDWELTQGTIEEQVARESYLQWIRDQEQMASAKNSPRSATCSSSDACNNNNQHKQNKSRQNNHNNKSSTTTSTTTSSTQSTTEAKSNSINNNNSNNINNNNISNNNNAAAAAAGSDPLLSFKTHLDQIPSPKSPLYQCSSSSSLPNNRNDNDYNNNKNKNVDEYGAVGCDETKSIMNDFPPQIFGLSDWYSGDDDDDDLMAQALAESQRQYFIELKRKANLSQTSQLTSQSSSSSSSSPPPSSSSSSSSPSSSANKGKSLMFKDRTHPRN